MAKQRTPYEEWLVAQTSLESHYVEKLMEHVFLGELLKECWFHRQKVVEVIRAEVDASGYDVILEADGIIRHVQLKATRKGGSTHFQDINRRLESRSNGCIIWMEYAADPVEPVKILYRFRRRRIFRRNPARAGVSAV